MDEWGCPFRAVGYFFMVVWMFGGRFPDSPDSQGVALGYDSMPLQGEGGGRFGSFCGTASPPLLPSPLRDFLPEQRRSN